jgi:hypothetical protein
MTELCLTGERITAGRLHALGAVNRLTDRGQALPEALVLAAGIGNGPANASARIKLLCQNAGHASLDGQLELEARLMVESQGDDEAAKGIAAFFDKRVPIVTRAYPTSGVYFDNQFLSATGRCPRSRPVACPGRALVRHGPRRPRRRSDQGRTP